MYINIHDSPIVILLDCNSAKGAHVLCKIGDLIRLRPLFRSTAVENFNHCEKNPVFLQMWEACYSLPSNITTMSASISNLVNIRSQ